MKQKLLITFIAIFFATKFSYGQISPSLSGTFVEGISPVNNSFSYTDGTSSLNQVHFYALNSANVAIDSFTDNSPSGNVFSWSSVDMGRLDAGSSIEVKDSSWATISNLPLTIIAKPSWLANGGKATNVTVSGNTIDFDAIVNVLALANNGMPNGVPGLTGRAYNLDSSNVSIHIQYDITQPPSNSTLSNSKCNLALNVFDQITIPYSYSLPTSTGLTLDAAFNLAFNLTGTYTTPAVNIKFPSFRFFAGPVPVKIDGGIGFSGTLKGQLVYGQDPTTSNWGFIGTGTDTSKITAKINCEGFLRVSADALVASASGSIIARGSIGGGFNYVSLPSPQTRNLFGLSLEIAGAIDYKLGIGWLSKEGRFEKTFYSNTWGDQLRLAHPATNIFDKVDALGDYTKTVKSSPSFEVQDYFAQPSFTADTNSLYVVWLDYDNNQKQKILFAQLDYATGSFSQPVEVISGKDVISNPKVAVMPSGSALITWTESRYNENNFNTATQDLSDVLNAEDIWATVYDKSTATFSTPFELSDNNTSSPSSGTADGQANIIMGKGNYGLITWVTADLAADTSDVYYCTVQENGSTWNFGTPDKLVNLSGTNKNVVVAYFDSTKAIASWINDPDGADSTLNNQVVYRLWDGTTWQATQTLIANDGMTSFDELSMDFNGNYGAVAYSSTHYTTDGDFEKRMTAYAWDTLNHDWSSIPYVDSDSVYYFSKPRVSVNKDGFTALTYQAIQLFNDTLNPDQGTLYMLLNDAATPNNWILNTDSNTIGDPNVYVADIQTSFDKGSNLFAITQESDKTTGQAPTNPPNGVRFGNNYLNLVLRAFTVNNTLAVSGTTETSTTNTITNVESYKNNFNFADAYPNPCKDYTTLKYSLGQNSKVKIELFDFTGRPVTTLFDGTLDAGFYTTSFEPKNLAAGIYFYKINVDNSTITKKLIIVK